MADLVDEVFGNVPEPEPTPNPEPTPEPATEPEAQPEPTPEPAPEPRDEERHVPLRTFLDTRDEAKEWKRKYEAAQAAAPKAPTQVPDSWDDPEGYNAYLESRMEERLTQQRFQMSDVMAKQTHGEDAVMKAVEWAKDKAQADPMFAASYMRDPNPIDWIVRQHKRDAVVSAIPTDVSSLDEWFEREAARRGLNATPPAAPVIPTVPAPAVKPASPPRSIASDAPASAPSSGNSDADFMAIFNKR